MFYKFLLIINGIILFGMAVALVFFSASVFPEMVSDSAKATDTSRMLTISYGFTSLAIAALCLFVARRPLNADIKYISAGTLAVFHVGLSAAMALGVVDGIVNLPFLLYHGVAAILFLWIFMWNWKWKENKEVETEDVTPIENSEEPVPALAESEQKGIAASGTESTEPQAGTESDAQTDIPSTQKPEASTSDQ
ncbi:hypothetical protein [Pontibacter sp. G13]|uniref:hypothetical protein n=1 Tax=Pontibacter sp. G13 TaxID=3074898 RepID=UPI00288C0880|nr:hypothetical protein [Pontibacter sp. G13]WNJ16483.1 hypothetical protein RJD25_16580 [Pontibacter sp. G13]